MSMVDHNQINILLVEDDEHLAMMLGDFLRLKGYEVIHCRDGIKAIDLFRQHRIHLCIFDVMLPRKDGFTLAGEIREINQSVPIIFLTAKSLEKDLIQGFHVGCDDYLTKPFHTEELDLRIKAVLKRCQNAPINSVSNSLITFGNCALDRQNLILTVNQQTFRLTRKEADLLRILLDYRNQPVSRELIGKLVWKNYNYFIGRSMDVFISRLRKYLSADNSVAIINIHGMGFRLVVPQKNHP